MPARQVLCSNFSISKAPRVSASTPHRMPACDTHRLTRSSSSSLKPNRRRQASVDARSSTSDAVTRPPLSSSRAPATASSGLVLVSARSASFTLSWWAGWPTSGACVVAVGARPKPAEISGAKVSMSGHMTRMSRGSRVGSSWRRPTSTSRSTSIWRAAPWQACTWRLRSSGATWRAARSSAVGAWLVRRSCWSQPSIVVGSTTGTPPLSTALAPWSARRSSRESRPSEASSGWSTSSAEVSSSRATTPPRPDSASQSAGDGCGSQRCTSRTSPSAASSSTSVTGIRVWPKSDRRAGRSSSVAPARSAATVAAWRTSGGSASTRGSSRRHSSACQARSSSSGEPAPSVSRPSRQSVTSCGRCTAYDAKRWASRMATE